MSIDDGHGATGISLFGVNILPLQLWSGGVNVRKGWKIEQLLGSPPRDRRPPFNLEGEGR
jgi:hypothetical protein